MCQVCLVCDHLTWFPSVPINLFSLPQLHTDYLMTCHRKRIHTYTQKNVLVTSNKSIIHIIPRGYTWTVLYYKWNGFPQDKCRVKGRLEGILGFLYIAGSQSVFILEDTVYCIDMEEVMATDLSHWLEKKELKRNAKYRIFFCFVSSNSILTVIKDYFWLRYCSQSHFQSIVEC